MDTSSPRRIAASNSGSMPQPLSRIVTSMQVSFRRTSTWISPPRSIFSSPCWMAFSTTGCTDIPGITIWGKPSGTESRKWIRSPNRRSCRNRYACTMRSSS